MNKYVKDVCKIGQEADCCRFLVAGAQGFECAKNTTLAGILNMKVRMETMTARGDNCEGIDVTLSITKLNQKDEPERLSKEPDATYFGRPAGEDQEAKSDTEGLQKGFDPYARQEDTD